MFLIEMGLLEMGLLRKHPQTAEYQLIEILTLFSFLSASSTRS